MNIYKISENQIKIRLANSKIIKSFENNEYILTFNSSNDLTSAVLLLYRNKKLSTSKSSLYKMNKNFILIIESSSPLLFLQEFSKNNKNAHIQAEYVREYGKAIILNNAISAYGKAFLK